MVGGNGAKFPTIKLRYIAKTAKNRLVLFNAGLNFIKMVVVSRPTASVFKVVKKRKIEVCHHVCSPRVRAPKTRFRVLPVDVSV